MPRSTRQEPRPVRIDDEFERLARELQSRVDAITERYVELVTETAPEWVLSDPVGMRLMAEFGRVLKAERDARAMFAELTRREREVLELLGTVHVGRVKLKPGKPFTFATLSEGRLAFGLPGFPVSSLVTFEVFVRPALRKMQGFARLQRPALPVRLAHGARVPRLRRHPLDDRGPVVRLVVEDPVGDAARLLFPGPHELVAVTRRVVEGRRAAVGRDGVLVYERSKGSPLPVLASGAPLSGWTPLAVVYRSGTPSLYMNGKLVEQGQKSDNTVHPGLGEAFERDVLGWLREGKLKEQLAGGREILELVGRILEASEHAFEGSRWNPVKLRAARFDDERLGRGGIALRTIEIARESFHYRRDQIASGNDALNLHFPGNQFFLCSRRARRAPGPGKSG